MGISSSVTSQPAAETPEGVAQVELSGRPGLTWRRCLPFVTLLVLTTAAWLPLFAVRVHAHQPNVDDYLYANLADLIWKGSIGFLHTGQTSPLVPTLAGPFVARYGINGGVFLQLPLLLATVTGAYLLVRTWIRPIPAMLTALAVGVNQAVIGYATMIHFSVAVTAAVVWIFYCYLRSDHLREARWCVALGVALTALLLSRSMAPSYVLPMLMVWIVDLILEWRRRRLRWTTVFVPALVVAVLAGPWWLVSGHAALHYLLSAGYDNSTGFSSQTSGLTPSSIYQHLVWFSNALAWPESIALGVAILVSLWGVVRYRRALNYRSLWLVVGWTLLTVLVLSSTGDDGSGFGLPVIAMAILSCGAIIGQLPGFSTERPWSFIATAVLCMVLLIGLFAEGTGGLSFWWNGPPYRNEVLVSGGSRSTNLDALSSQVGHIIGSEPTLDAFGNAILNGNGLIWTLRDGGSHLLMVPDSADSTKDAIASLAKAKFVISGSSLAQYPPPVDQRALELAAEAHNFRPTRAWVYGTGESQTTVVLWQHGPPATSSNDLEPEVQLLDPAPGAVVSGVKLMAASISGRYGLPVQVSKVEFLVSGEGLHDVNVDIGSPFLHGWLGAWNTSRYPAGRYVVTCLATANGRSIRSRGVAVQVKH